MKKLFSVLTVAFAIAMQGNFSAAAQAPVAPIHYNSFGNYSTTDGVKISKADLQKYLNTYEYSDYLKSSNKLKVGYICTGTGIVVGAACIAAGTALTNKANSYTDENPNNNAAGKRMGGMLLVLGGAVSGVALLAVGVPKIIIGHSGLKKLERAHNNGAQEISLELSESQYGVGLALRF